jgi:hypothetical protein
MLRKALTTAGIAACALVLSGVTALAGTMDAHAVAAAPEATPAPATALAAPGACADIPALSAVFARDAAPVFTPLVQSAPLQADGCTSCTVDRGCFPCGSVATQKAPCAITDCCGVITRSCGTCSNHCVPPPA